MIPELTLRSRLLLQLLQSLSNNWRQHVNGLAAIIDLRGGLGQVFKSPHMRPVVLLLTA